MSLTPDSTDEVVSDASGFVPGEVIPRFGGDTIRDSDLPGAWIQIQLVDRDDEWIDEEVFIDAPSPGGEVADVMEVVAESMELENDQVLASRQRCLELLNVLLQVDPNAVLSLIWVDAWTDETLPFHEQACAALGTPSDDWFYENATGEMETDDQVGDLVAATSKPDSWYTYDGAVTTELLSRYVDLVVNEGFPSEDWHFTDSRLFSLEHGIFVNALDANGVVVFALDEASLAPFAEKFGDRIVNSSAAVAEEE